MNEAATDASSIAPRAARLGMFAAMLVFVVYAVALAYGQRSGGRFALYPDDRAYVDLAVASRWAATGSPVMDGVRIPLQVDALWQALLAVGIRSGAPASLLPIGLSLAAGLLSLWRIQRLACAIGRNAIYAGWVLSAWVLIGPMSTDLISGQSFLLATAFAILGWETYLRGLSADRVALPLATAIWMALAALMRIEFIALWLTLGMHALLLSILRRIESTPGTVLVRWLNGLLVFAIALCPVIWWNVQALQVPWPPAPDAVLTLNAVSGLGTSVLSAVGSGFRIAAHALGNGSLIGNGFVRLFVAAGALCLLIDVARGRADIAATTVLAGLLVPLSFAPFYPFLGAESLGHLQRAVAPLWCLAAGYVVARVAAAVGQIGRQATRREHSVAWTAAAALLLGAIPILAGVRDQIVAHRLHRQAQQAAQTARLAFQSGAQDVQAADVLASDAPGWLLFSGFSNVVDLSGRLDPILLTWMGGNSVRDPARLRAYLAQRKVRHAVFWRPPPSALADLFDCPPLAADGPWVCAFRSREDF